MKGDGDVDLTHFVISLCLSRFIFNLLLPFSSMNVMSFLANVPCLV